MKLLILFLKATNEIGIKIYSSCPQVNRAPDLNLRKCALQALRFLITNTQRAKPFHQNILGSEKKENRDIRKLPLYQQQK